MSQYRRGNKVYVTGLKKEANPHPGLFGNKYIVKALTDTIRLFGKNEDGTWSMMNMARQEDKREKVYETKEAYDAWKDGEDYEQWLEADIKKELARWYIDEQGEEKFQVAVKESNAKGIEDEKNAVAGGKKSRKVKKSKRKRTRKSKTNKRRSNRKKSKTGGAGKKRFAAAKSIVNLLNLLFEGKYHLENTPTNIQYITQLKRQMYDYIHLLVIGTQCGDSRVFFHEYCVTQHMEADTLLNTAIDKYKDKLVQYNIYDLASIQNIKEIMKEVKIKAKKEGWQGGVADYNVFQKKWNPIIDEKPIRQTVKDTPYEFPDNVESPQGYSSEERIAPGFPVLPPEYSP